MAELRKITMGIERDYDAMLGSMSQPCGQGHVHLHR
jgi:hypothetical protein